VSALTAKADALAKQLDVVSKQAAAGADAAAASNISPHSWMSSARRLLQVLMLLPRQKPKVLQAMEAQICLRGRKKTRLRCYKPRVLESHEQGYTAANCCQEC
jgi:hypothetical protein